MDVHDEELDFDMYSGDDPVGFVVSKNLARRHLDVNQRAMIASELANLPAYRPKKETTSIDVVPKPPGVRIKEAAKALNVSPSSVDRAAKIQREAKPEVVEAVKRGGMSQ